MAALSQAADKRVGCILDGWCTARRGSLAKEPDRSLGINPRSYANGFVLKQVQRVPVFRRHRFRDGDGFRVCMPRLTSIERRQHARSRKEDQRSHVGLELTGLVQGLPNQLGGHRDIMPHLVYPDFL